MKRILVSALALSLAMPAVVFAQGEWEGKFDGKTKATGWKASMVQAFDGSQLVGSAYAKTWEWNPTNDILLSDCSFLAASIQSKAGKDGKFMLSGLSCPNRPSLPSHLCVEVVGISAIARFEDTKKNGTEERPCIFASSDVAGDVSQTRNVAVLCPVDASKGSVKCSLPGVAENPCVDAKKKPTNDINTQMVDAVVYDNSDIINIDIPIGNDIASLASCDTGDNKPMGRIGTFINAK